MIDQNTRMPDNTTNPSTCTNMAHVSVENTAPIITEVSTDPSSLQMSSSSPTPPVEGFTNAKKRKASLTCTSTSATYTNNDLYMLEKRRLDVEKERLHVEKNRLEVEKSRLKCEESVLVIARELKEYYIPCRTSTPRSVGQDIANSVYSSTLLDTEMENEEKEHLSFITLW